MRATEHHSLHFDFSHLDPQCDYTFQHGLTSLPLRQHSAATRAAARTRIPLLKVIPDERLTHFVEADLPSDAIVLLYVTKRRTIGARTFDHPVHLAIHVPREGHARVRTNALAARRATPVTLHPKLAQVGVTRAAFTAATGDNDDAEHPEHIQIWQNAVDAAVALLFHHGSLINLSTDNGGQVPAQIISNCISPAVTAMNTLPLEIWQEKDAWLVTTVLPATPSLPQGTTSLRPSKGVMAMVPGPLKQALLTMQNDITLQGQQWNPRYGATSAPFSATVSGLPYMVASSQAGQGSVEVADPASEMWVPTQLSDTSGFSIDDGSVSYTPPAAEPAWTAQGVWSMNDIAPFTPLTADAVTGIRAGNAYLQIATTDCPQGLLQGPLVVGSTDPDTGMTSISATLSGSQVVPPVSTTATGTATFTLNPGGTGLTYRISILLATTTPTATATLCVAAQGGLGGTTRTVPMTETTGTGTLSIDCTNKWLRHLSACVQYLDVGGNVLTPQGVGDRIPTFLRDTFEPDQTKKFIALIPPVTTVFGVPVPATATTISIPVWEEVHTVRLLFGGLGRGAYDSGVCPVGITVTALAELALPVFVMAAGAAITNSSPVKALMADTEVLFAVCAVGGFLAAGASAAYIATAQSPGSAAEGLAEQFGPMLLSPATSLGKWVAEKIVEGAAERAAPFVDIALAIINGAVTAAELSETIIEVLESPFVFTADVNRSTALKVTLVPDSRYNKFPDYHNTLRVVVMYDVPTTQPVRSFVLPGVTLSDPIVVSFPSIPAGGNLRVYAFFYAQDGWQSGQAMSAWVPATSTSGLLDLGNLEVQTNMIPLTSNSTYLHQEKIGMVNGEIDWIATATPPSQTVKTTSDLVRLGGITIAQEPEMIGYVWQGTGLNIPADDPSRPPSEDALWTVQNLSLLQHPQTGYAVPDVGFTEPCGIAYNIASADGSPTSFFIDSSNADFDATNNPGGGYHVRGVSLAHSGPAPSLKTNTNLSYGRFPIAMDRYAYHPQGYLVGINYAAHKLFQVPLIGAPVADACSPMAVMSSGQGERDGLMFGPVGIAVSIDGRILVLESANERVQAFDIDGNAVPSFKNPSTDPDSPSTIATMALQARANSTYLDISVESQGYIYILSYTGDGSDPTTYQVDLYHADGTFLVTTPNLAAAKIAVDILRGLYTLNYEEFQDATGRPQPSVSMWLPPAPPPTSQLVS